MFFAFIVNKFFINFIGNHENIMRYRKVSHHLQIFQRGDHASGIGRTGQDQCFCFCCVSTFQFFFCQHKVVFFLCVYHHRHTAGDFNHFRIAQPKRCGNDDFITFVQNCHKRVHEGVFCAVADDYLCRFIVQTVVFFQLVANSFPQCRCTCRRCISCFAFINGFFCCFSNMCRGVKIRFPYAKCNHILALCFQFCCFCGDCQGAGCFDALCSS